MYQTTTEVKNLFKNYYRQTVYIRLYGTEETIELSEENLMQNSLTVDRYTVTADEIEVGTAVAAEITFKLDNRDGYFDDITLEGAEMFVQVGIKEWGAENATMQYIPLGYFLIEDSPRKLRSIEVTAYDRMRKFDQVADSSLFYDGATVASYIYSCCEACGVTLATTLDSLPNSTYKVPSFPEGTDITYRQIIQWCAAITGTCAYFDWNGHLRFEWYIDNVTGETIASSDRYDSDIYENDVVITGVSATLMNDEGDDVEYMAGEEGYVLDLSNCSLLQSDGEVQAAIDALGAKLVGFSYRPYSCETKPMPWLYPLDTIEYIDKNKNSHTTIITNATFNINAHSDFQAKGETAITSSYYVPSITDRISQIIAVTKSNSQRISTAEQMIIDFNNQLQNASGLYSTVVESDDGNIYYFHDKSSLEESGVIYVFNSGGFAWTTSGWNGDDTVWEYGFDSAGNGILNNVLMNYLNVNKLTADEVNVSAIVGAINESSGDSILTITADHLDISGGDSSFSYSLGAEGFVMKINDETVLEANSSGLMVYGAIYAESGEIAGLVIEANYSYDSDGTYAGATRKFGNSTDTFHILVTEDADGNATDTEVLITDLYCDNIMARNSSNSIDLCYSSNSTEITATLTWDGLSYTDITSGGSVSRRRVDVYITITLSEALLADKTLTITLLTSRGQIISETITISKGSSSYSISPYSTVIVASSVISSIYFSDTGTSTTRFTTTEETDQMIKIKGNVIPDESGTYNFGHSEKLWGTGYFTNLYLGDYPVAAPYQSANSSITVYTREDDNSGSFSSNGTATIRKIKLGNLYIAIVTYTETVSNDTWYRFTPSVGTIIGVQCMARAVSGTNLGGDTHGGCYCCYYTDSRVYIGCDTHSSAEGFTAIVFGLSS